MARGVASAFRSFRRNPGSSALAVVTLALGIGGATAFFAVIDAAYLRPLPFPDAARLTRLLDTIPAGAGGTYTPNLLPAQFDFLASRSRVFAPLTAQRFESFTLLGSGEPRQLYGASVSSGSLALLGLEPEIGRPFSAREEELGDGSGVVLISHRLWQERFAGDREIPGRSLRLDDRIVTVIGVAPPGFNFPYHADIWQPLAPHVRTGEDLLVLGRLRTGASLADARAELAALSPEMRKENSGPAASPRARSIFPVEVRPLRDHLVRDQERTAATLLAAASLFLLMACVNLAGLLLARVASRRRELALKSALGASPARLLRALLVEPLAVSALAGLVALAGLAVAGPELSALVPQVLSEELGFEPVSLNLRVGGFALVLVLLSAAGAGIAPAWQAVRGDIAPILGSAGAASRATRHRPLRTILLAEILLLCVLLLAAGGFVESFLRASRAPLGFEPEGVLAMQVNPPAARYDGALKLRGLVDRLRSEIGGVAQGRVAVTTIHPFDISSAGLGVWKSGESSGEQTTVNLRLVSPGYFSTLRIPLLRGRDFGEHEGGGEPSVVVSRRLARRLWGEADPIGRELVRAAGGGTVAMRVVGEVDDLAESGMGGLRETAYVPFDQAAELSAATSFWIVARADAESAAWVRDVQTALWRVDPELAWSELAWMRTLHASRLERDRLGTHLATAFAVFAILLASLGLGGVVAFVLSQRESEMALRQAMGADGRRLVRLLTGETLGLAIGGTALGVVVFALARPFVARLFAGAENPGLVVWLLVPALILTTSAIAAYLPARRVARIEPASLLRRN